MHAILRGVAVRVQAHEAKVFKSSGGLLADKT
jgi:hypothetical protein